MYACTEQGCSRSFKRPEHLSRHRLNHQPRKIHRCLVCDKDFVRLDLLQRHMRRHNKGMAYRSSGGYSTRGRPSAEIPDDSVLGPASPAASATEAVGLRGQASFLGDGVGAAEAAAAGPPHDPSATVLQPDGPEPMDLGVQTGQGRDGQPAEYPQPATEYLTFFEGSNDVTGLSQDLDWLFGSISPWDVTAGLGGLDADFHLSVSPASNVSQCSAITPSRETVSAYWVPRERILHALAILPPEVLNSSFFETTHLEQFMQNYWQSYNPHFSLLHKPTFSVQDAPPLLLVALLTLGATLSPDPEHYQVAEQIHQNLRWLIFTSSSFQAPAPLWVVQALLVVQAYEKMFSTRKLHEMSHIFHYSVITLMRRGSCYSAAEDEGDISSLEKAWHRWVERELSHRAAYFAFIMDAQHSSIFGHTAALTLTDIHLPLPCADSLWEASTAPIWNRERVKVQPSPLFLPALRALLSRHPIPHTYSPFARFVLLHGLFALTRHMVTRDQTASCISTRAATVQPQSDADLDDNGTSPTPEHDNWKARLDRAIDTWSFSLLSQTPSLCLEAARPLRRIAHVSIHVSLVDIHILAGAPNLSTGVRAGRDSIQLSRAYKRILAWAHSRNAKRALSHCLLLIQETMFTRARYVAAKDSIILRPWVLYNMTLVLWAYGAITSGEDSRASTRWTAEEYLAHMLNALMGDDDAAQLQGANNMAGLIEAVQAALEGCRWELLEEARETLGRISTQRSISLPERPNLGAPRHDSA
ncbi:hypothetical protein S40293_07186 [Stachybotrys chartarum IBT 40293]|nr:hypothetical protein S40293_07186 [Stachybotrys chartarum IBT 40293]